MHNVNAAQTNSQWSREEGKNWNIGKRGVTEQQQQCEHQQQQGDQQGIAECAAKA